MAVSIADLRDRIGRTSNTQKITSAMRLVAAAKVRRAQEAVTRGRPFAENLERVLSGLLKRLGGTDVESPLVVERPVKSVALLVLSGDRGLCGSYNNYIIKKTEARLEELESQGIAVKMLFVGTKASTYFKRRNKDIVETFPMGQAPTAEEATRVAEELQSLYLSGEADRVEVLYTNFVSMIASVPTIRSMLPLTITGKESEGDEIFRLISKEGSFSVDREAVDAGEAKPIQADCIFEQEPEEIVNSILPLYFNGQILKMMQESVASELAARMTAMQSASDNASALKKALTIEMNRARQAKITQELMEIVAGAEAV
jgi:F-type H+-transporting ATPase subunit gamma